MKTLRNIIRISILAVVLLSGKAATAQYGSYYYHRTGDTIHTTPDNGYFAWWDFDYFVNNHYQLGCIIFPTQAYFSGIRVQRFFTPAPLRIVGIAGCVASSTTVADGLAANSNCDLNLNFPSPRQEYFYLYDNDSVTNNMVFKGRLAWNATDAYRVLELPCNLGTRRDTCCHNSAWRYTRCLREYYFDSAITVDDTFYVGGSYYSNIKYIEDRQTYDPNGSYRYDTVTRYFFASSETGYGDEWMGHNCADMNIIYEDYAERAMHFVIFNACYFPYITYMRCSDTSTISHPEGNYTWVCDTLLASIMIYPIIEIDTTQPPTYLCDPVQNLEASIDTAGCLNITWDDFLRYSYCEVQYYSMREGYGSNHTETVYGNRLTVCDLDTSAQWCVRVRAFCDTSKILTDWTPWLIAGRDMPSAVDGPSSLASFTSVAPNPATKTATVTSCFGMRGVEVYNMRGILVYVGGAPYYTSTEIDLHGWAPGQYIVIIETPAGKTAKRLTVVK